MRKSYGFLATLLVTISQAAFAQTDITTPYSTATDGSISQGEWNFLNDGTTTHGSLVGDLNSGISPEATLNFFGQSTATLSANRASNIATFAFHNDSSLSVIGFNSLYYGSATFSDNSSMSISASYSVTNTNLTFQDDASLQINAEWALSYATTKFIDNAALSVNSRFGLVVGTHVLEDNSSIASNAQNGLYAGTFKAGGNSSILLNFAQASQSSSFELSDQATLNINAANAIAGGTVDLSGEAQVVIGADGGVGLGSGVRLNFDNSSGGTGGMLVLNGHDSSIGALFSENGAGVVRNGAADDAVLGIDSYFAGSFSGTIEDGGAGSLGLAHSGGGTLTLSGSNTYTGTTQVSGNSTLVVANDQALGSASGGTIVNFATLALTGDRNVAEPMTFYYGKLRNLSGISTLSGVITLTNSTDFYVDGGSLTITGDINSPNTGWISSRSAGDLILSGHINIGTGGLQTTGGGSVVINGDATNFIHSIYVGRGGGVVLDFANMSSPQNVIEQTASVQLSGATLKVLGKPGVAPSSQVLSGLTLEYGQNQIILDSRGGGGTSLSIGSQELWQGSATLNVSLPAGTSLLSTMSPKTLGNVTVTDDTGTGLARTTGTEIVRVTGQTALAANSNDGTVDFSTTPTGSSDASTPYLVMDGDFNVSSLTIDTSLATGANVLDLAGHTMNVESSGLLMQGENDYTILGGQVGGTDKNLYIHTLGDGRLTITGSVSGGDKSVIKAGDGVLVLTGQSSYTGQTAINGGELIALSEGALGNTSSVLVETGAALTLGGGVIVNGGVTIREGFLNKLAGDSSSVGLLSVVRNADVRSEGGLLTINGISANESDVHFDGDGDLLISGPHAGGRKYVKDGAGTMIVETTVSPSEFILNGGVLQIGNGGTTGRVDTWLVNNGHVVFNRSDTLDVNYRYSGTGTAEIKSGIVRMFGSQEYTGRTTVSGGTLSAAYSGTTLVGDVYVEAPGTLEGNSGIGGEVVVSGTISPGIDGNLGLALGTLSSGSMTWNEGGTYHWEINNATDGSGWDHLAVANALNIAATSADKFKISVNSFDSMAPGVPANFMANADYNWSIANAGSVSGFDASKFVIDSSGFHSPLAGGEFAISQNGQDIVLSYIGVYFDLDEEYRASTDGVVQGKWDALNNGDTTHGSVIADTAGSFASNAQVRFRGDSHADLSAQDAMNQGRLEFYDQAEARAGVASAISGGQLTFDGSSKLLASVTQAVTGGSLSFTGDSSLVVTASDAIGGGTTMAFGGASHLDLEVDSALMYRSVVFSGNAVFNANVAGASLGNNLEFHDNSKLKASAGSLIGGSETFYDSSVLEASGASAVSDGTQTFHDNSRLKANAEEAVSGGYQNFHDASVLEASATNAINGGQQTFYDDSSMELTASLEGTSISPMFNDRALLKISDQGSIKAGTWSFSGESGLEASTAGALNGGTQAFSDHAFLNASAADAVRDGNQSFYGEAKLEAAASSAVSGGRQTFYNDAVLEISASGAVSGGVQDFQGSKNFDVDIANGVTGGEQILNGLALNANVSNALGGNTIKLNSGSTINVNAENAINGSNVEFGVGTLAMKGHSATVGGLSGGYGGGGVITNESASPAVLTVSPASGIHVFGGYISESDGAISLVKTGDGVQAFEAPNSYSGGTTVSGGTLSVRVNGATGSGSVNVESLGTLEGNSLIDGEVFVSGTVSPGFGGQGVSISPLYSGAMTWNEGGAYHWEINNVYNNGWDTIGVTNTLNIAATSGNAFTISINSFDLSGDPGAPGNFDPYLNYSWNVASAGEITGFDAAKFALDTTGFHSSLSGGQFSISQVGQNIVLSYLGVTRDLDGLYQTSVDGQLNGNWEVLNDGVTTDGRVLADAYDSLASGAVVRFRGDSYAEIGTYAAVQQGAMEFHDQSEARISAGYGILGGQQLFFDDAVARADANYAIYDGHLEFNDSSKLIASQIWAVKGGTLIFRDNSSLVATAQAAVDAPVNFYGNSHLDLEATGALGNNGTARFYDNAVLNASAEGAMSGGSFAEFFNNSKFKASAGSLTAGTINFYNSSSLEANEALAVTGGYQTFFGDSRLKAAAEDSVQGGNQNFIEHSIVEASATRAISGGSQTFQDDSILKISARNAVTATGVYFRDRAAIEFSGEGSIGDGQFTFVDDSKVTASVAGALEGGHLYFNDNSSLEATVSGAVSGGEQQFRGNSWLDAQVDGAVSGGAQFFYDAVMLQVNVAGAISGGEQYFNNDSTLDITVAGGIRGGTQYFYGSKNFDVGVADAVLGGEQVVQGVSLNANVTDAMRGGTIRVTSGAIINVNANNAINGSNVQLDDGSLALKGHNVTLGGVVGGGAISSASAAAVVLTIAPASGDWSHTGDITETDGVISVVKAGAGVQSLSGNNSYTGGTTISGGQLFANSNNALGTGLVTIESGGTLGGYGTLTNTVIVGGTVSPGYEPGSVGTLTTGSETWNGGGIYLWDVNAYYNYDFLQINGTLALTNTAADRFTIKIDSHGVEPFDPYNSYSWDILTASDGISGFDASAFRIDTSDFVSPGGSFKLVIDGNSLRLEFTRATHQVTDTLVVNQSNGIYNQVWEVLNDGTTTHGNMIVNEYYGIAGGDIAFRGQSQLEATSQGAIQGGTQTFNDDSKFLISAQDAIGFAEQTFNDNSVLEIGSGGALGYNSTQTFNENSKLNVVNGTLNGSIQNFYDDSVLTIGENGFLTGGEQTFRDGSSLVYSSENAMGSNTTKFYDESSFVLDSENLDTGSASVKFYDTSKMKFTSGGKLNGGTLLFYVSSSLVADKAEAITGGSQTFYETSKLVASSEDSVLGGEQTFYEQSSLTADGTKVINGGTQSFTDDAYLEASAAHAVYGGIQNFYSSSKLKATAVDSIDGGHQYFYENAMLEASASAILSGTQDFTDSAKLNANGANSVKGGTQQFFSESSLVASVSNAVTGGEQHFSQNSTLEANAANSLNGGLQLLGGNSVLNANIANSVGAANVVLFSEAKVSVNAANALSASTHILFNGIGGAGGVLELNGHSTTVGRIESESGGGRITNSNAAATLTVNISSDRSIYEGLIENGSAVLAIVKEGLGELELSGENNSYSGGTTINAGTLIVSNTYGSATGTGNVLVGANGTLAGTGVIAGSVNVQGKLSPGNSPGLLTIEGNLTLQPGSTTTMEIFGDEFDQIFVGGSLEYGGALVLVLSVPINWTVDLFSFASLAGTNFSTVSVTGFGQTIALARNEQVWSGGYGETTFTFDQANGEFIAVPEPTTNLLLALGVGALLFILPRRKK